MTILDIDGNLVSDGLESSTVSDQAIQIARRAAAARGDDVILYDGDDVWRVGSDGHRVALDHDDLSALGLIS